MTFIIGLLAAMILVVALGFAVQVVAMNRAAPRVFGPDFCWLAQGADVTNIKQLDIAPRGAFLPNPLRQLNRRFLGIGIDDPEVLSPHLAIIAIAGDDLRIAAWSYRRMSFWQEDQEVLRRFVSHATRDACRQGLGQ